MPEQDENKTDDQATQHPDGASQTDKTTVAADPVKRSRAIFVGVLVALVLIVCAVGWWLHASTYETTDDAQVDGHLNPIAARVNGTVSAVYVEDNQRVRVGQAIVDLDTRDSEVDLAQAQADYDQALAQLNAEAPNVPITRTSNRSDVSTSASEVATAFAALQGAEHDYDSDVAKLRQAEATSQKSQNDLGRYKQLVDKQELARSDYDQYVSTGKSDASSVDAAAATAASQKKLIEQKRAQWQEQKAKQDETLENAPRQVAIKNANTKIREANLKSYGAKLEQAKLNLAYCHVVAPVNGIVLQRSAELGSRITSGQQLLMVGQVDTPWVIANFKETQVHKMHPGQQVDVTVDALSKTYRGVVENMPAATGDRASVLPSQNATGNYVKVIQRLPVRIRLDDGQTDLDKLRPGMSVEPKVHLD